MFTSSTHFSINVYPQHSLFHAVGHLTVVEGVAVLAGAPVCAEGVAVRGLGSQDIVSVALWGQVSEGPCLK